MSKKEIIYLQGMTCVSCEVLIADELKEIGGISQVKADHKKQVAYITHELDQIPLPDIQRRLNKIGYAASLEKLAQSKIQKFSFKHWAYAVFVVLGLYLVYAYLKWIGVLDALNVDTQAVGYGTAILVGIVASLSTCLAVVGAVVMSFGALYKQDSGEKTSPWTQWKPHVLFHIGRLTSFAVLGGLLGIMGSQFTVSTGFMGWFTIVVAIILLMRGLQIGGILSSVTRFGIHLPKGSMKLWNKMKSSKHPLMPVVLGAFTFVLPCGFTQSMQLLAIASGSFVSGLLLMFLFALGTVPVLLFVGKASSKADKKERPIFQKSIALIVILFAWFTFSSGKTVLGIGTGDVDISNNTNQVVVTGDEQVIQMAVDYSGFNPSTLRVKQGTPVRWVIDGQQVSGCTNRIVSKAFGINKPLVKGENIVTFTPSEKGTFQFSCGMGMVRGKIIVE